MILPEGSVILFTLLVIPNLLANATICGIRELANALVLASTGLKLVFLLHDAIVWLLLLNFLLVSKSFNYFLHLFLLCPHLCLPERSGERPKSSPKDEI